MKKAYGTAYEAPSVPKEEGWTLLYYNELQYPPSPCVKNVFIECTKNLQELTRYGSPDCEELCASAAKKLGVKPENVRANNGSDAVLAVIFQAFFAGKTVAIPDPSYGLYRVWAENYGVNAKFVPLSKNWTVDLSEYAGADAVLIANPNAPTGLALSRTAIERFVRENPKTLVVVDEAYIEFAEAESCAELIARYANLIVVRTFSKAYGLAGLRVGYAVACEKLIDAIRALQAQTVEFPLARICAAAATAALEDAEYLKLVVDKVKITRERFTAGMRKLGFEVLDSQTNFVFVRCRNGKELFEYLKTNKILVRRWDIPRIKQWLRITIGTDRQMKEVLRCVKKYLEE